MASTSAKYSANVEISHTILSGFTNLDADTLLFGRSESCVQYFMPSTMNTPPKTNEEFREHVQDLRALIKTWPVIPYDTVEDVARRKVAVFCRGRAEMRDEVTDKGETEFATPDGKWVYVSEYVFVFEFDEHGKVVKIDEWLDSENTNKLRQLMKRARENVKGASAKTQ